MNFEILQIDLSPAKTLQNELCLMKIGQSSQKIQSFEVESTRVFSNCSTEN